MPPDDTAPESSAEASAGLPAEPVSEPSDTVARARGLELARWFEDVLAPVITRDVAGTSPLVWCRKWWAHPEAVARIIALHEAWTVLVDDEDAPGDGASMWWLNHVDHHLAVLLSKDKGPFSRCAREHKDTPGLASDPVPAGGFPIPPAAGAQAPVPEAADEAARLDSQQ